MKILIDSADISIIRSLYEVFNFDGVTTNPKLLARIDGNPFGILKQIRREIPEEAELHVQVVSSEKDEMLREAKQILDLIGRDTHIKIPVCRAGYSVIRELASEGVKITATAIYNEAQAAMALHEGAFSVAPYIHRINNKGYCGVTTALQIQKLITVHGCKAELLAAAFESTGQVMEVMAGGADSVTVAPELLTEMVSNIMTEDAVKDFYRDFNQQFKQANMRG